MQCRDGISLKQRRWLQAPHRLPQRPGSCVHLQWAAHTAKPDAQDLTCKQRLCLFTQDRVFTACAYTQTPSVSSQMIICGSRCLCFKQSSFHSPEIVHADLGHCLSTVDPFSMGRNPCGDQIQQGTDPVYTPRFPVCTHFHGAAALGNKPQ